MDIVIQSVQLSSPQADAQDVSITTFPDAVNFKFPGETGLTPFHFSHQEMKAMSLKSILAKTAVGRTLDPTAHHFSFHHVDGTVSTYCSSKTFEEVHQDINLNKVSYIQTEKTELGRFQSNLTAQTGMAWQIGENCLTGYQHIPDNLPAATLNLEKKVLEVTPFHLRDKVQFGVIQNGHFSPDFFANGPVNFLFAAIPYPLNVTMQWEQATRNALELETGLGWTSISREGMWFFECSQCLTENVSTKKLLEKIPNDLKDQVVLSDKQGTLVINPAERLGRCIVFFATIPTNSLLSKD